MSVILKYTSQKFYVRYRMVILLFGEILNYGIAKWHILLKFISSAPVKRMILFLPIRAGHWYTDTEKGVDYTIIFYAFIISTDTEILGVALILHSFGVLWLGVKQRRVLQQ